MHVSQLKTKKIKPLIRTMQIRTKKRLDT